MRVDGSRDEDGADNDVWHGRMIFTHDACRMEHTISEESFQKIQELVKKIKKKIHQRNKWKNNGNAIKSVVRSFVR